jgi:DNA-binding transcriptional ArsR family regulator
MHQRGFGFHPMFGGGPWGEREHRQGRGRGRGGRGRPTVRNAVLALLVERPMHGYETIQELERRTGGIWRPSLGSVYPTLQLLEDEGLITAEESGGRKRFALTGFNGTDEQRGRALEVLTETRRKLYAILAESE